MKRFAFFAAAFLLLLPVRSFGQSKAIGLRLGGGNLVGAEVSYQTPFGRDRAELDLGWGGNSEWAYWSLTGLYQWVFPIESGFYWYVGVGPALGSTNYSGPHTKNDGLYLALALNAGAEYNFSEIPLQLAIDTRPELPVANTDINNWFGLALAVRYRF
ncbi:MAG TPA: hypothetical protein GXZ39_00800 [Bacteroidales bacterium]|nr:hypothetical protein [Bacteroidales bacterium]